ncbi:MAG TPA: hypothetical protein VFR18_05540 [Terriglobia bacterium]|nr:hypothetical protein [Terriglobia bacterium]
MIEEGRRIYRHSQIGTLILLSLSVPAALSALGLILVAYRGPVAILLGSVLAVLAVAMILFCSLTIEVTENRILVSFGPGVIRKHIRVDDICGVRIVRNPWYYGWGVRLTPQGWLLNVSGLNAVEIDLSDSRKFRIGTDEPHQLSAAIEKASRLAG